MLRNLMRLQGVAGLAALSAGVYLVLGLGFALIAAGVFLTFGAWSSR